MPFTFAVLSPSLEGSDENKMVSRFDEQTQDKSLKLSPQLGLGKMRAMTTENFDQYVLNPK